MQKSFCLSIQEACQPKTKEEQLVWDSLDKIWAKTDHISTEKIEKRVSQALKEVRLDTEKNYRRS